MRATRREVLRGAALLGSAALASACAATPAPVPLLARLPRWRGFNLLEKSTLAGNKPYLESDLVTIAEWGFNFVRLPTDYRIWTAAPGEYREGPLREIDDAIAWARALGVHANLALHRAPGYCVNPPKEPLDLWADGPGADEARRQFAAQWRMFARRYRGIPARELSFNLLNEPPGTLADEVYLRVVRETVQGIRDEDADRLIIADGASWAQRPVPALAPLRVVQSLHGYAPGALTHYRAPWREGADALPLPTWPVRAVVNRYLYGDQKRDLASPLVLDGRFARGSRFRITVTRVSDRADLSVRADGAAVLEKSLRPESGPGEHAAVLPADASSVRIEVGKGDWLAFSEIRLGPPAGTPGAELVVKPGDQLYGVRQGSFAVDAEGGLARADGTNAIDRDTLWRDQVEPFQRLEASGVGVHVGEFGAYSQTPHQVALAWMADCLANWRKAGWGWALWNLRGAFGPLASGRTDVAYENYKSLKLDRKMLDLLLQG